MKCPHCGWRLRRNQLAMHLTFHLHVDFGEDTPRREQHDVVNGRPATPNHDMQAHEARSQGRDHRKALPSEARGPFPDMSATVEGK